MITLFGGNGRESISPFYKFIIVNNNNNNTILRTTCWSWFSYTEIHFLTFGWSYWTHGRYLPGWGLLTAFSPFVSTPCRYCYTTFTPPHDGVAARMMDITAHTHPNTHSCGRLHTNVSPALVDTCLRPSQLLHRVSAERKSHSGRFKRKKNE